MSTATTPPDGDAAGPPARRGRPTGWRIGTPVVLLLCAGLVVVSANQSEGTDLRPGRYTSLASLVETEAREQETRQAQARQLEAEVRELTEAVREPGVRRRRAEAESFRDPAGLEPKTGAGLSIVMSDAPEEVLEAAADDPDSDLNLLLVHQQDIQSVVNALWAGGAEAITIQGQRIVSTTGIKCEGSAVQLQGIPYPQPYTIEAVGDPAGLLGAIDDDADVQAFVQDAERPGVDVGWQVSVESQVEAAAFEGLVDFTHAQPLRTSS